MDQRNEPSPERVLVLAPTGRDARMVEERLLAAGITCEMCRDMDALVLSLRNHAGAALIAQEALDGGQAETLLEALNAQEPWSDLPVLLLTLELSRRVPRAHPGVALLGRANVVLLPRPMPAHLFVSAVRSAVRARRRQYEMRGLYSDLSRAMQLADMFVSMLGHDLRTPLGAIKMAAEIIIKSAEDPHALRPAGRILRSADRMTRMIEQLLDVAQIRQGRGIRLQLASADLGELTRQVLQELGDANPTAMINVSTTGNLVGRWDPDRLGQVVSNLVGNSVQHGTPGGAITVALDGTGTDVVRLRVANAGAIAPDALPTLFEPFKRVTWSGGRGLGLGLFIAREIVRGHGGELAVSSVEGTTSFEATLPREARPTESAVLTGQ